jgi:DNA-binding transcriptional MerR regulator
MFTIGDFARTGRVSIRMLRHYDEIGLLHPVHVDPSSGYRFYTAAQLSRLNRIVALKDLGFTLRQVQSIIDDLVSVEELRGMLRLRRVELAAAMAAASGRLVQVEARLRALEREGAMPSDDVVVKRVPAVRVLELTAVAESYEPEDIGPVIQPLYKDLMTRMEKAGIVPAGPGIAYYEDAPDGRIVVHAGIEVTADSADAPLRIVDLPVIERAATIVHRGSMDGIAPTEQALARWLDASGFTAAGYAREVSLECPESLDEWVTELQTPLM